jgi:hypothetical protein
MNLGEIERADRVRLSLCAGLADTFGLAPAEGSVE